MKFNKSSQMLAISAVSLLAAAIMTACATNTVDFVYVSSAKAAGSNSYGEIDVFEVNSESGRMRQITTSPFPSGGRNPVAEAVSPDFADLYVVNEDDNSIVQFIIGNDGKLYPQNTVNTPGVFPMAASISGTFLFVADTYQPLPTCSPASPCSGSIGVFPILTAAQAGTLKPSQPADTLLTGMPINACNGLEYLALSLGGSAHGDVLQPAAENVSTGSGGTDLWVTAYDTTANTGYVFGFAVGTLSCPNNSTLYQSVPTLTSLPGSPFAVGTRPSALASDPGGSYLYVADAANAQILGFQINSGTLSPLSGSPFKSGNIPSALVVDGSGKYAVVTNSQDSNITVYSIGSGNLTALGTYTTGTQPTAIGIDPSLNQYLYTANFLGNTVSGFELNSTNGSLLNSQGITYAANANPTAIAAIPHGSTKK